MLRNHLKVITAILICSISISVQKPSCGDIASGKEVTASNIRSAVTSDDIEEGSTLQLDNEFHHDRDYIYGLCVKDGFSANTGSSARQLYSKWRKIGGKYYYLVAMQFCESINELSFNDAPPRNLAKEFAMEALEYEKRCPIYALYPLIRYLSPLYEETGSDQWQAQRLKALHYQAYAIYRFEQEAVDVDSEQKRYEKAGPPVIKWDRVMEGIMVFRGYLSPDDVKDPIARKQYVRYKKWQDNGEALKARKSLSDEQYNAKDNKIREVIVDIYTQKPYNIKELKTALWRYPISDKTRREILDKFRAKTGEPDIDGLKRPVAGGQ